MKFSLNHILVASSQAINNLPFSNIEIVTARDYAIQCHSDTNHLYDGKIYAYHLFMVFEYGYKYKHLLDTFEIKYALSACWVHDVIEDCRQTYNDVKKVCGEHVAEIAYALTNEKGKTRKERANEKYYAGIRQTPVATFVKLCDRVANIKYNKENNGNMLDKYREERSYFQYHLYDKCYADMFKEMEELLA